MGMSVYGKRDKKERQFIHTVVKMHQLYQKLDPEGKKEFEMVELVEDSFIGVLKERDLLIFVRQMEWKSQDSLKLLLKEVAASLKTDYQKYFIYE